MKAVATVTGRNELERELSGLSSRLSNTLYGSDPHPHPTVPVAGDQLMLVPNLTALFGRPRNGRGTSLLLVFISLLLTPLLAPLLTAQNGQKSATPVLPSAVLGSPLIVWSQAQKPAPLPVLPNLKGEQPPPGASQSVEPSSLVSPELTVHKSAEEGDDRLAKPPANSVPLAPIMSSWAASEKSVAQP